MGISDEIKLIRPGLELHRCPTCGYEYGFHTSFMSVNAGKDGKENPVKSTRELYRVILICPECGARFDVGWRISFSEEENPIHATILLK
jgi:rubredoxin